MNPFGYNLKSRCRNKPIFNRSVTRDHDTFGYNERSEVIFSRGDAEDAEYSYDEIGNLVACSSASITNQYVANNLNQYTTILRDSATPREINPQCDIDGNLISKSGPIANFFRHRFSTKYFDTETELYYYGYRFYHPVLMRWLSRDPIGEDGGLNLYAFVMNNPIARFDTDGCFVLPIMTMPDSTPISPSEPSPSVFDHLWFAPLPVGEEKWFQRNYAGWIAEARRRFTAEIERGIDCKATVFDGPSKRIKVEPSENRSGSTSNRTPGGNERQYGDAGQSDWSANKVLGSFSIDYVTPVKIIYTNMGGGKRRYNWSTEMYVYDVLGTQEYDPIRRIPVVGDIVGSLTPSRDVKRARWILSGSGVCDCDGRISK